MQDQPKIVVVGGGYWGKNLIRNFAKLGALAGICEVSQEVAIKLGEEYKVPVLSWKETLTNTFYNAVAIATPAKDHAELAWQALEANKDVFVEKPLALQMDDAEKVGQLAFARHRILMVGHLLQYHPAFTALKLLAHEGKLGRLQYLYSNRLNLGKIRREEDILWSFAPHDISMILSLVNEKPSVVKAMGGYFLHKSIADVTTTHLEFPSGVQAHIFVSWLHPHKEQKLVVVGSKGMAVFDDAKPWTQKLAFYSHQIHWRDGMPFPDKADATYCSLTEEEPLTRECQHFIDCVKTREQPITDAKEGLRVLEVLNQATKSLNLESSPRVNDFFIHETAVVDNHVALGKNTKVWHFSHILEGCKIGENCIIGQNVMIGPDVKIGNYCKIQNNVSLYKGVTLEDGVFCGPSCVFTNVNNPRAEIERKNEFKKTYVERGVTIGANATIVCGVHLGAYSLIGAGAVVTKDVKPHALVLGNPARQVGWVSHAGERLDDRLICPREGRRYGVNDENELIEIACIS
ncbi:oxidoreductase [Coxiella burnetii]|uniref:Gfo/Idh/MocA family oxidoreductase n=1 Tax=Coxiella burnetii TaxID=777 RepID=UPI0000DAEB9F|nr:Gfo/Idh/MocA family oxidoreductase [Coxiella burnetii]ABX78261.1 oxidoreductase, NAD-binding/hexapeptide-repeat-containing transferase [Coxiella burnetii RSA 331]AML49132.1 oxidoreductase [Coxiella burnetii]AML55067.1 oxidoreductase [Coxiella burnetii]ATN69046.1 oxidoreductase [Coxiella burnetii]ATN70963.1 oxidoreductase [Coxiella burnetii]